MGLAIASKKTFPSTDLSKEQSLLYQKGWKLPDQPINWTSYIFYGADIKDYAMDYIGNQIKAMINIEEDIRGLFYINDDEGELSITWEIFDSKITIKDRPI